MLNPERPASSGLASRSASNVVPWATGMTRSVDYPVPTSTRDLESTYESGTGRALTARPSFDLKLDRAEQHLSEIGRSISDYVGSHPYEVLSSRPTKRRRNPYQLTFTSQPDEMLGVVVGDFIHNVRSSLDHLAAALVPRARRNSVMFPVLWPGVWEPAVPDEDEQRRKERANWITYTTEMDPAAVEVLKQLQPNRPRHDKGRLEGHSMPGLVGLNRLSNHDKHSKLPVVSVALLQPTFVGESNGEQITFSPTNLGEREALPDGAEFVLPDGVTNVSVFGSPQVAVKISHQEVGYWLPGVFEMLLRDSRAVVELLRPFVN